jgi:hypothetical protein
MGTSIPHAGGERSVPIWATVPSPLVLSALVRTTMSFPSVVVNQPRGSGMSASLLYK